MVLLRKSYKDGVKLQSAGCGAAVCRPSRPLGRLLPTERHATGGLRWSAAPLVGRYSSSSGGDSLTCWLLTRCQPFSALKEGTAIQVVHDNAPSADRIVCRGRAGEQVAPPRGSVSDGRQPTERKWRPPRWAARLQARVGSGSASPPPARADEPGQRTVSSASLAWRALCLLADAPMLPGWDAAGRGHRAQLLWDPRPLPHRAGSATPSEDPWCVRGSCG